MGYNYRNDGMPDCHAPASEIASSNNTSDPFSVHNTSDTVGSPNPTSNFWDTMSNSVKSGNSLKSSVDLGKKMLEEKGLQAAGSAIMALL